MTRRVRILGPLKWDFDLLLSLMQVWPDLRVVRLSSFVQFSLYLDLCIPLVFACVRGGLEEVLWNMRRIQISAVGNYTIYTIPVVLHFAYGVGRSMALSFCTPGSQTLPLRGVSLVSPVSSSR